MLLTQPDLQLDPLWALTAECAADLRLNRLNLVIGVYRDEHGVCPVPQAVQEAELRLASIAATKEYTSPSGNIEFNAGITDLVLGDSDLTQRARSLQAVGGTGALRLLAELLAITGPERTVHLGVPAYVNHVPVLQAAGLRIQEYAIEHQGYLNVDAVVEAVRGARAGDVLLLQGACHNPTGLTMPVAVWEQLGHEMNRAGVIPLIDHAYFGLGDGLEEDLAGMRRMLEIVPEGLVAVSASKVWGLYSERTGCAVAVMSNPERGTYVHGVLEVIARAAYSQAPSHGARVVAEVLGDDGLRAQWRAELDQMRERITGLREGLVRGLTAASDAPEWPALADQRGMFLRLPLSPEQMARLRIDHAVYGVPSGRINLAGVPTAAVDRLANAILEVHDRVRDAG